MTVAPPRVNKRPVGGESPPHPPTIPTGGRFVRLEPWACAGNDAAPELYAQSHGDPARESVWDFLPYGPFADAGALRAHYDGASVRGDPQFFVVRHLDDGRASGVASFLRINPGARTIEIGHIWHAANRQRGRANTETALLLAERAFGLGYRRLEWKCDACNLRSRRAALRLGFSFEGVFRKHLVFKGRNRDTAWFAMTDDEFPKVQAATREWLDAPEGSFSLAERNRGTVEWSLGAHDLFPVGEGAESDSESETPDNTIAGSEAK